MSAGHDLEFQQHALCCGGDEGVLRRCAATPHPLPGGRRGRSVLAVFGHPAADVVHEAAGGGGLGLFILDGDADIAVEALGGVAGGHGIGAAADHQLRQEADG